MFKGICPPGDQILAAGVESLRQVKESCGDAPAPGGLTDRDSREPGATQRKRELLLL